MSGAGPNRSGSRRRYFAAALASLAVAVATMLTPAGSLNAAAAGPSAAAAPANNDYPTSTRVDYVIGCMAANGNTREAMMKCSCAIDTIAGLMPYKDYEEAETALSMQAGGGVGGRVGLFRDPPEIKKVIEQLRQAQAEANLQCF
jgi:hypothetical protein